MVCLAQRQGKSKEEKFKSTTEVRVFHLSSNKKTFKEKEKDG